MKDTKVNNPFEQRFLSFASALKGGTEQRDAAEVAIAVGHLRKIARSVTPELFTAVAGETAFVRQLLATDAEPPLASTEEELSSLCLCALLLYRQGAWKRCQHLLQRQLFSMPGELIHLEHLEPLTSYLFGKYLLCVERDEAFIAQAEELFFMLKRLQLARAEQLYATLLVFNVRWLLRRRKFERLAALLRQTTFPATGSATLKVKFLFYKALFAEAIGKFALAIECIEQATLKASERPQESKGYRCFRLLLTKHLIVLSLMLSRSPPMAALRLPQLRPYLRLAALVSRGQNREFEAFIAKQGCFQSDLVMPVLNRMQGVVLRNALKKLAAAYTGISAGEALRRLGVEPGSGFDLQAFVAQSRDVVERFSYDAARQELRFESLAESFSDTALQQKTLDRLRRVELLSDQLRRGLRYAPRQQDAGDRADAEPELEELDLEGLEFDDLDFED